MESVVDFNKCPYIFNGIFGNKYLKKTNTATDTFPMKGGWRPLNTNVASNDYQPGRLISRDVTNSDGTTGYELDVIPNWNNLSWVGGTNNSIFCDSNNPLSCETYELKGTYPLNNWAGYTSEDSSTNANFSYMVKKDADGCNHCLTGNKVLCTTDVEMDPGSCPGYKIFEAKPPKVKPINNNKDNSGQYGSLTLNSKYYATLTPSEYPRGKGVCYYEPDTIQSDEDLKELLYMKEKNEIEPKLADELAANYCYSTDKSGKTCGYNKDHDPIKKCTKYKVDENISGDGANQPCTLWRASMQLTEEGKQLLDKKAIQWCNSDDTIYTPLCDCIRRRDIDPKGTSGKIRNFYEQMKQDVITTPIPDRCWFEPCKSRSYAMELYTPVETCPITVNVCNAIMNSKGAGGIDRSSQYTSCVINQDAKTVSTVSTSTKTASMPTPLTTKTTKTTSGVLSNTSNITNINTPSITDKKTTNYTLYVVAFISIIAIATFFFKQMGVQSIKQTVVNPSVSQVVRPIPVI